MSAIQPIPHQSSPWLANVQPKPTEVLRLICFPYAGGSSIAYHNWSSFLPPSVAVYPVQLPGRGARWREKAHTRMPDLVEEALNGLRTNLKGRFAFFGHSMGALIAFETARRLAAEGQVGPEKLYVSGRKAPHLEDEQAGTYLLPNEEFIERLRALNGTPSAVLDDPELVDIILPLVRADFELVQTYSFEASRRLNCPITAFGGTADSHVSASQLEGWGQQTTREFSIKLLPGDHFFILHQKLEFLRSLSDDLNDLLSPPTGKQKHLANALSFSASL